MLEDSMAKQQRKQISARGASLAEQEAVYKRGCCRRQRGILGGRRPQRRGNGSRLAARPARRRSYKNGHESGEREGSGISYASFALLQVRRLIFWCRR